MTTLRIAVPPGTAVTAANTTDAADDFPWSAFTAGLAWTAAAALAVMLVAFAIGVRKGVHRVVDIAWGIGFAAVALTGLAASAGEGGTGRRILVTALTVVWGLRLAVHIGRRSRGRGEDPRYDAMLARAPGSRNAYALRKVYLLQGALVWLVSLPVQAAQYAPGELGAFAWAGTALWTAGLFFEAIGDAQLARFKADPSARGRIMDRGLWSWTRHPNYFGDFCVWWGLFLIACDSAAAAAVSAVSPLVMSFLLIRGSGKALLERHMSDRPGYAEYTARTSGFFPRPPHRTG
jgi:steroid 5-alpha reductase family enzyme